MVVPVSLRPDRRGQVYVKGRGWIPKEETREYQRKKQREEARAAHAEEMWRKHRKRRIRQGIGLIFGDN